MQHQLANSEPFSILPEEIILQFQSITTNDVLPDDQIKTLQTQRTIANDELQILEAEIVMAELKAGDLEIGDISWVQAISSSKRRHRLLTKFLNSVSICLAPHKLLPTEILSQIFTLALHGYSICLPLQSWRISPLTFCHTCSRWRQVALNTPEIWTSVTIRHEYGLDPFRTMDITEQWFARSYTFRPLSLAMKVMDWRVNKDFVLERFISRLVVPYRFRLERLDLCLHHADFIHFLLLADHDFPTLKCLQLTTNHSKDYYLAPSEDALFAPIQAQNLQELKLKRVSAPGIKLLHVLSDLPWRKLTCLHISTTFKPSISVQEVLHALSRCYQLKECSITTHSIFREGIHITPIKPLHIHLPHLSQLTFASSQQSSIDTFLQPLWLPSLKELIIHCRTPGTVMTITDLYQRSQFPLELLHLVDIQVGASDLWDLVLMLPPSLKALLLGLSNVITEKVLRNMLENNKFLPNLLFLVGKIVSGSLHLLIEVLEKRCGISGSSDDNKIVGYVEGDEGDDIRLVDNSVAAVQPQIVLVEYEDPICDQDAIRIDRLRELGVRFEASMRPRISPMKLGYSFMEPLYEV